MKSFAISILAVLSTSVINAAEPVVTQQERDHAIQLLRDSQTIRVQISGLASPHTLKTWHMGRG
jgi:hypothetical protein